MVKTSPHIWVNMQDRPKSPKSKKQRPRLVVENDLDVRFRPYTNDELYAMSYSSRDVDLVTHPIDLCWNSAPDQYRDEDASLKSRSSSWSIPSDISELSFIECLDYDDDWEMLSPSSPMTESRLEGKSYAEALASGYQRNDRSLLSRGTPTRVHELTRSQYVRQHVDMDECTFDAWFVMDGLKNGMGGRRALRFKGNQKVPSRCKPKTSVKLVKIEQASD